jgi:holo-[acyl-carrier protein] synthase
MKKNEIFGIGIDAEEIKRFEGEILKNKKFLNRIFTGSELKYCLAKKDPARHLAARFAGKEAVMKSLAYIINKPIGYNKIEILNDKNGRPVVSIRKFKFKIFVSLSHTRSLAIANAVICK